jgi:hypothetical protein
VKKPLNAFLGEVFLASWDGKAGKTQLVSEQVSHHPPVTACYLWNDEAGVRAEGYTCQEISFHGSVNIKQIGHAILHIDRFDEDYLIPLPDVKVKSILTGTPYPELHGTCHIVSSNGFISEIDFSGKGLLSGKKNSVDATIYREGDKKHPIYTVSGQWNGNMTFVAVGSGTEIETIDVNTLKSAPMNVRNIDEQDPVSKIRRGDVIPTWPALIALAPITDFPDAVGITKGMGRRHQCVEPRGYAKDCGREVQARKGAKGVEKAGGIEGAEVGSLVLQQRDRRSSLRETRETN